MLRLAALDGQVSDWLTTFGPYVFYAIVWGLVFAGTGLFIGAFIPFITGDSLLFAAGILSARNDSVNIWALAIGVGIAAFLGDQLGFVLGRHYGRPYLDRRRGAWVRSSVARAEKFYDELGWWAVVVARFIPWGRVLVPPVAGIARMNYMRFLAANVVGALAWGVLLTVTGYFAASIPAVKSAAYLIGGAFILSAIIAGVVSWRRNRSAG
ncbi:MAG: putative rane-associated protein [Microbacteriaceae bacterium]|jgi:membrane-associated protein|nr:putative rane-associated protein [Microbacteriaceae bacterium]